VTLFGQWSDTDKNFGSWRLTDNTLSHTLDGGILKLSPADIARVRRSGLHITERCDGCPKILNQSMRWTIQGRAEVYCCEEERDRALESLKRRGALKDEPVMPRRAGRTRKVASVPVLAALIPTETPIQPGATKREI